ncbi:hypothetical protein [Solitalea lacus]|uniref:hypothetical protein n=1 Tax=Solitalea lacus TaxID=2911172 RepID=UPI001EDBBC74|nr:hypothetical protein [Solitalea lacus]UKJ09291.1 hypothetical protein L2B55_09055 [Solitalea lacus]
MFSKMTVKAFALVAIILSSFALLLCIAKALLLKTTLALVKGIVSWTILLWASIIGFKLCSSYNLYDDEYEIIGPRIYTIILASIVFILVEFPFGALNSFSLLFTIWELIVNTFGALNSFYLLSTIWELKEYTLSVFVSFSLLTSIWELKVNYDQWEYNNTTTEIVSINDTSKSENV